MPENIPNDASSACRHRPDSHVDGVCLACLATYILEPGGESIPGHQDPVPPGLPDLTERYELGDQIGEGGFARVFRARQVGIDREVAVKIYKAEDSTQRLHSRLVTELRALAPLKHPNIVTVHEVGIFEGKPAIVMELLEGLENIVEYSEKRRIGITGRLGLLIDVCSAVHHLHSREPRILHRDIKPENILVIERDDHAAAKLLDFGIAKVIDDSALGWAPEVWQTHAGSLHYMSPEQAEGPPNIVPASDVFSLGVLM